MCLVQTSEHNFKFQELNTYRGGGDNENWLQKDPDHCSLPLLKEVSLYLQLGTSVVSAVALVISGFISHYKLDIGISGITSYINFFFNSPFVINKTKLL